MGTGDDDGNHDLRERLLTSKSRYDFSRSKMTSAEVSATMS